MYRIHRLFICLYKKEDSIYMLVYTEPKYFRPNPVFTLCFPVMVKLSKNITLKFRFFVNAKC